MKEYGEGVKTKAEAEAEKWRDYQVDKEGDYICSVCKKTWIPDVSDVNTKRPSTYYKLCKKCRMKAFLKGREFKQKKGTNNYDKLRDEPNNQTGSNSVAL